jgi:hypothetical protein
MDFHVDWGGKMGKNTPNLFFKSKHIAQGFFLQFSNNELIEFSVEIANGFSLYPSIENEK